MLPRQQRERAVARAALGSAERELTPNIAGTLFAKHGEPQPIYGTRRLPSLLKSMLSVSPLVLIPAKHPSRRVEITNRNPERRARQ
jgi:hypothetical protein